MRIRIRNTGTETGKGTFFVFLQLAKIEFIKVLFNLICLGKSCQRREKIWPMKFLDNKYIFLD